MQTTKALLQQMPMVKLPNYIFRNTGDTFSNHTASWGMSEPSVSSGAAYADLDNDGDMDLVINNNNEEASLYRNNAEKNVQKNNYIKLQFIGSPKNRNGIGAAVKVWCSGQLYYQENFPVRGFQSCVDGRLNFGIGNYQRIDSIWVRWPDNKTQKISAVLPNQTINLDWRNAAIDTGHARSSGGERYCHENNLIPFLHRENAFNDFTIQPLLPGWLSRPGPCMAKADIDNDGLEDLFIGGAHGQRGAIFLQNSHGRFVRKAQPALEKDAVYEDVAAEFFDANNDGSQDLYISSGGYEFLENGTIAKDRLYINDGNGNFSLLKNALPAMPVGTGCVTAADIDGDKDLDLFAGARVIPGNYPLPPRSWILKNNGKGIFEDVTQEMAPALMNAGMITDALWKDMNGDGKQDLITVGEWMAPAIYLYANGRLQLTQSELDTCTGWWNKILADDFDNDGDVDLVLGNLGKNTQLRASRKEPVTLYYKDFDGNGSVDPILCYYINGVSYPAASKDDLTDQLPMLRKKFPEYHQYANATIDDLFTGEQLKGAKMLKAEMLTTVYIENRGREGFALKVLPAEAQYAPVYAMASVDANHDGKKDILLAGNNSRTRIKFGRYNASHALLLTGDGKGNFTYVPQTQSGFNLRGDVRSLQVIDAGQSELYIFGMNNDSIRTYVDHKPPVGNASH